MYLTPQRFREMGFGIDISELDDAELLSLCKQASAVVDSYCNVPRIPQKHDFRGGTITDEEHTWGYPQTPFDIGRRRMYLFHYPIIAIQQFRIMVTNTQYITIAPTELMINKTERYFEVVSLAMTGTGLFNALIIPNVALAVPIAHTSYTYGWDLLETDEEMTCTDGQTWRAQNQFWHTDTGREPVIKVNGAVVTTGFTVNANEGAVVFTDNLLATDTVSATYHYKLPSEIQFATGHIIAYLHGQAELHSRGMAHLTRLRVAEVDMERDLRRSLPTSLISGLDNEVPEAAILLSAFRADNITIR